MSTSLVHTDVADGVFTLTLDAPDTGNALDVAMTNAVANALERANAMPDVHCVLIRSSGRHFCTGGNVKDMARGTDLMAGTAAEVQHRLRAGLHRITRDRKSVV